MPQPGSTGGVSRPGTRVRPAHPKIPGEESASAWIILAGNKFDWSQVFRIVWDCRQAQLRCDPGKTQRTFQSFVVRVRSVTD